MTYLMLVVLAAATLVMAQPKKGLNDTATKNLITAIQSENTGLKRSAMYFAGYYKIDSAVEALRSEMQNSSDPSIQILAALSLYEIGDESVMEDLQDLAGNTKENLRVREMAKAIYDHWTTTNYNYASTVR